MRTKPSERRRYSHATCQAWCLAAFGIGMLASWLIGIYAYRGCP